MNCINVTRMLAERASHHVSHAVGHAHRAAAKVAHAVAKPLTMCGEVAGPLLAFQAARLAALAAGVAAVGSSAAPVIPSQSPVPGGPSGYATASSVPAPSASAAASQVSAPVFGPNVSGRELVGPVAMQDPFAPPATQYALLPSADLSRPSAPSAVNAPAGTVLLASATLLAALRLRRRHPR